MAVLGFRKFDDLVGHSELLDTRRALDHFKAKGLDLSKILQRPDVPGAATRRMIAQDHGLESSLDLTRLVPDCMPALEKGEPVSREYEIRNIHRTVGTILGSELTRRFGGDGLPDGTISLKFNGTAGQSFGAFLPRGMTLTLEGDANDYIGKGLSGGRIIVFPPKELAVRRRGQRLDRQRGTLRRDRRAGFLSRPRRRAIRRPQQRRSGRRGRSGRPLL